MKEKKKDGREEVEWSYSGTTDLQDGREGTQGERERELFRNHRLARWGRERGVIQQPLGERVIQEPLIRKTAGRG